MRFLKAQGFKVLRFWDNDALSQTEAVLEAILASIHTLTLTPDPSPDGRGEISER
jgi:very-short-patch-repair endonuclease